MPAAIDITGESYGLLVALRKVGVRSYPSGQRRAVWLFRCECGKEVEKTAFDVRRADTKSCGCARRGRPANNRMGHGQSSFNAIYMAYRKAARGYGRAWDISKEEFAVLTKGDCHYCGISPSMERKAHPSAFGSYIYNGIDRRDSTIGYVSGNVVSCCWDCNRAKGSLTESEFMKWLDRVLRFQEGKSMGTSERESTILLSIAS